MSGIEPKGQLREPSNGMHVHGTCSTNASMNTGERRQCTRTQRVQGLQQAMSNTFSHPLTTYVPATAQPTKRATTGESHWTRVAGLMLKRGRPALMWLCQHVVAAIQPTPGGTSHHLPSCTSGLYYYHWAILVHKMKVLPSCRPCDSVQPACELRWTQPFMWPLLHDHEAVPCITGVASTPYSGAVGFAYPGLALCIGSPPGHALHGTAAGLDVLALPTHPAAPEHMRH